MPWTYNVRIRDEPDISLKSNKKLYNIEDDPTETTEISDEHPLVVHQMLAKLADYYVRLTL